MHNNKMTEVKVAEWFQTYGDKVYTYLAYLTFSMTVEELAAQAIIQAVQAASSRQASKVHPHVLVLASARTLSKKQKHKHTTNQHLRDFMQSAQMPPDYEQWLAAILSLPDKQREVFLLREVLGTDSRQTSQIVKYTSVKVESLLRQACKAIDAAINNEATKQILRKLDDDPSYLYESALPQHIHQQLLFSMPNQGELQTVIHHNFHKWKQSRRRRRMLTTASGSAAVVIVAGLAAWAYKPWNYFLRPAVPVANSTQLHQTYTKTIGFIPRLPSSLPKGYHLLSTSLQTGNGPGQRNEHLYSAFYWTGQKRQPNTINIIEGGKQVEQFTGIDANMSAVVKTLNGVKVHIGTDKQNRIAVAHFAIGGTYYSITNNGDKVLTPETMTTLLRSMIIHPQVIAQPVGYRYQNFDSLGAIETKLNFKPTLLPSIPKAVKSGAMQLHGFLASHNNENYGTCNIIYTSKDGSLRLSLTESKGTITDPTGQKEGALFHAQPGQTAQIISGLKVYSSNPQQSRQLFWKVKQTGVSFEVNIQGNPTSVQQAKLNLKQIAQQLIEKSIQ